MRPEEIKNIHPKINLHKNSGKEGESKKFKGAKRIALSLH